MNKEELIKLVKQYKGFHIVWNKDKKNISQVVYSDGKQGKACINVNPVGIRIDKPNSISSTEFLELLKVAKIVSKYQQAL